VLSAAIQPIRVPSGPIVVLPVACSTAASSSEGQGPTSAQVVPLPTASEKMGRVGNTNGWVTRPAPNGILVTAPETKPVLDAAHPDAPVARADLDRERVAGPVAVHDPAARSVELDHIVPGRRPHPSGGRDDRHLRPARERLRRQSEPQPARGHQHA
jgi:hypothetical protein